jgi:hypothetical protein|nr:hypothetical protein [Oxalobacteraceae bacterium]
MNQDQDLDQLHQQGLELITQALANNDPLEVASMLTVMGLRIYRSVLSAEDYDKMIQTIAERRHDVQIFRPNVLQ